MKAARILRPGGPDVFEIAEVDPPEAGAGQVLVKVRCTALNRADLLQRRGQYPPPAGVRPDIPGLEYSGVVANVGEGVDEAAVGSWVMGLLPGAGYAELVVATYDQTLEIPKDMEFSGGAAIPEAFCTAWDALLQAGFLPGMSVLVHAAGSGVGTAALQLASAFGAKRVYGTASKTKLDALASRELPLDVPIDYRTQAFHDVIRRDTGGKGVDIILDLIGASYWTDNLASLAVGGRIVLIGLIGGITTQTNLGVLLRRRLRVIGTVMRSRSESEKRAIADQVRTDLLPLFATGQLQPVVDRVFPLEEVAEAHRYMEENRNTGKIVLRVS
ncbi:MAG: NAD(P)H-quinone oxidoreductase [Gemmatimonadales bacterium]|nr:MAG: NAD(P)H-quinone oxidoreductase [Gemmatimonadales bacterium]